MNDFITVTSSSLVYSRLLTTVHHSTGSATLELPLVMASSSLSFLNQLTTAPAPLHLSIFFKSGCLLRQVVKPVIMTRHRRRRVMSSNPFGYRMGQRLIAWSQLRMLLATFRDLIGKFGYNHQDSAYSFKGSTLSQMVRGVGIQSMNIETASRIYCVIRGDGLIVGLMLVMT
jgi:hypothetical protein